MKNLNIKKPDLLTKYFLDCVSAFNHYDYQCIDDIDINDITNRFRENNIINKYEKIEHLDYEIDPNKILSTCKSHNYEIESDIYSELLTSSKKQSSLSPYYVRNEKTNEITTFTYNEFPVLIFKTLPNLHELAVEYEPIINENISDEPDFYINEYNDFIENCSK